MVADSWWDWIEVNFSCVKARNLLRIVSYGWDSLYSAADLTQRGLSSGTPTLSFFHILFSTLSSRLVLVHVRFDHTNQISVLQGAVVLILLRRRPVPLHPPGTTRLNASSITGHYCSVYLLGTIRFLTSFGSEIVSHVLVQYQNGMASSGGSKHCSALSEPFISGAVVR